MKWIVMGVVTVVVLIVLIANMKNLPKDLYHVAKGVVPIYASENEVMALSAQIKLKLNPSQQVAVIECIDVKHYQIYKVAMPDGTQGFVIDGSYALQRYKRPAVC